MRAVRFHAARDVRVEDVPEPAGELGPTQVLLRPRLCGICGSDLREYVAGPIDVPSVAHPLTGVRSPVILGHELSADVEAVGSAVRAVKAGDRVAVMPEAYCGECGPCRRGLPQMCEREACVGLSWPWGGLAEQAVVEEYQAIPLPDDVSYEQGALIEPAAVAINAVKRANVRPGDAVLVTGAGPIGALSVLAARAAGAERVFLAEPNARRAERAASLGLDGILDPRSTDVAAELRERTNGLGVDVAIECSGNEAALRSCLESTRIRGTVAEVGLQVKDVAIDAMGLAMRELALVGVYAYSVDGFPQVAAQIAAGAFPVERVVTSTIALEDAVRDGFERLVDPAADDIKILVATA
jgi:(R,R)-butanediol dehydrogenase / meso-butanediol dehydrogenase / diacetyl reductase